MNTVARLYGTPEYVEAYDHRQAAIEDRTREILFDPQLLDEAVGDATDGDPRARAAHMLYLGFVRDIATAETAERRNRAAKCAQTCLIDIAKWAAERFITELESRPAFLKPQAF